MMADYSRSVTLTAAEQWRLLDWMERHPAVLAADTERGPPLATLQAAQDRCPSSSSGSARPRARRVWLPALLALVLDLLGALGLDRAP